MKITKISTAGEMAVTGLDPGRDYKVSVLNISTGDSQKCDCGSISFPFDLCTYFSSIINMTGENVVTVYDGQSKKSETVTFKPGVEWTPAPTPRATPPATPPTATGVAVPPIIRPQPPATQTTQTASQAVATPPRQSAPSWRWQTVLGWIFTAFVTITLVCVGVWGINYWMTHKGVSQKFETVAKKDGVVVSEKSPTPRIENPAPVMELSINPERDSRFKDGKRWMKSVVPAGRTIKFNVPVGWDVQAHSTAPKDTIDFKVNGGTDPGGKVIPGTFITVGNKGIVDLTIDWECTTNHAYQTARP